MGPCKHASEICFNKRQKLCWGLTMRLSASRRILHSNVSEVVFYSRLCKSCGLKEGSRAEMYARRST